MNQSTNPYQVSTSTALESSPAAIEILTPQSIKSDIKAGWVIAMLLAAFLLVVAGYWFYKEQVIGTIDLVITSAIYAGLAYGIYRKSRICAVAVLVLYLALTGFDMIAAGVSAVGGLLGLGVKIFIVYCLYRGVRGTVAYHRFKNQRQLFSDWTELQTIEETVYLTTIPNSHHLNGIATIKVKLVVHLHDADSPTDRIINADTIPKNMQYKVVDMHADGLNNTVDVYRAFASAMRSTTDLRLIAAENVNVAKYFFAIYAEQNMGWSRSNADQFIVGVNEPDAVNEAWSLWVKQVRDACL